MNLTLSLLAGLLLLLPGLGAVAAWNNGSEAARRPELQLTSLTVLFAILALSMLSHLATYGVIYLLREAAVQFGDVSGVRYGPVLDNPYVAAFQFTVSRTPPTLDEKETAATLIRLACFLVVVVLQSAFVFLLVRNPGLDVVFEKQDLRGQGWAFQRIVRPSRHGFVPYARVFTTLTSGDRGLGYEGVIAELRQGADGEIKSLFLAECHQFTYELVPGKAAHWLRGGKTDATFTVHSWIKEDPEEEVALDAAAIRHVVLDHLDEQDLADVLEEGADISKQDQGYSQHPPRLSPS